MWDKQLKNEKINDYSSLMSQNISPFHKNQFITRNFEMTRI